MVPCRHAVAAPCPSSLVHHHRHLGVRLVTYAPTLLRSPAFLTLQLGFAGFVESCSQLDDDGDVLAALAASTTQSRSANPLPFDTRLLDREHVCVCRRWRTKFPDRRELWKYVAGTSFCRMIADKSPTLWSRCRMPAVNADLRPRRPDRRCIRLRLTVRRPRKGRWDDAKGLTRTLEIDGARGVSSRPLPYDLGHRPRPHAASRHSSRRRTDTLRLTRNCLILTPPCRQSLGHEGLDDCQSYTYRAATVFWHPGCAAMTRCLQDRQRGVAPGNVLDFTAR